MWSRGCPKRRSAEAVPSRNEPQLRRIAERERKKIAFTLDGAPAEALEGDTLLTALKQHGRGLSREPISGPNRRLNCGPNCGPSFESAA